MSTPIDKPFSTRRSVNGRATLEPALKRSPETRRPLLPFSLTPVERLYTPNSLLILTTKLSSAFPASLLIHAEFTLRLSRKAVDYCGSSRGSVRRSIPINGSNTCSSKVRQVCRSRSFADAEWVTIRIIRLAKAKSESAESQYRASPIWKCCSWYSHRAGHYFDDY